MKRTVMRGAVKKQRVDAVLTQKSGSKNSPVESRSEQLLDKKLLLTMKQRYSLRVCFIA